jgi:TatD DNase family protein
MFFDAHTHLNDEQLINKQAEIIKQCQHNSVKGIVNIGTNKQSSMSAVEIAHRHDSTNFLVKATVGIHPYLIAQKMITIQEATQDCHDLLSVVQEEKKN